MSKFSELPPRDLEIILMKNILKLIHYFFQMENDQVFLNTDFENNKYEYIILYA